MPDTTTQTAGHAEALSIIQQSGVLNPKMPLGDFLDLTHKITQQNPDLGVTAMRTIRYVIHDHYLFLEAS